MRAALGLPMTGKIEFDVDARSADREVQGRQADARTGRRPRARSHLVCPTGCTFGDGKTKLKPLLKNSAQQAMVGEGIDFGKVNIDSLVRQASTIKNGKLEVTKFDAKSSDGELHVDFAMTLDKEFDDSIVAGCLRFKGSDALLKREPKTYAAISTTGAELRSDGLFHIRLTDRFSTMKRLNQECGPTTRRSATARTSRTTNRRCRPSSRSMPPEPPKPT